MNAQPRAVALVLTSPGGRPARRVQVQRLHQGAGLDLGPGEEVSAHESPLLGTGETGPQRLVRSFGVNCGAGHTARRPGLSTEQVWESHPGSPKPQGSKAAPSRRPQIGRRVAPAEGPSETRCRAPQARLSPLPRRSRSRHTPLCRLGPVSPTSFPTHTHPHAKVSTPVGVALPTPPCSPRTYPPGQAAPEQGLPQGGAAGPTPRGVTH